MNELVKVDFSDSEPVVLGRNLHTALKIKTAYKDWFPRMCEYGFEEEKDFCSFLSESTGGRPSTDHRLTLDMAKEICMIQRSEIGKRCREYFIEVEKKFRMRNLSPAQMLLEQAKLLVEHEQKLAELSESMSDVDDRVKTLEAKSQTQHSFSIMGYASFLGLRLSLSEARQLGKAASRLSRELCYKIDSIAEPRFGRVNVYHEDILVKVFKEYVS